MKRRYNYSSSSSKWNSLKISFYLARLIIYRASAPVVYSIVVRPSVSRGTTFVQLTHIPNVKLTGKLKLDALLRNCWTLHYLFSAITTPFAAATAFTSYLTSAGPLSIPNTSSIRIHALFTISQSLCNADKLS